MRRHGTSCGGGGVFPRLFALKAAKRCKMFAKVLILQSKILFYELTIFMATTANEIRREWRFYVCLSLGFSLMVGGFWVPPLGVIDNSVIIAAGILLCIGALAVGIDIKGCIHELRLLRSEVEQINEENGKD